MLVCVHRKEPSSWLALGSLWIVLLQGCLVLLSRLELSLRPSVQSPCPWADVITASLGAAQLIRLVKKNICLQSW